jgi:hypothetical protein
MNSSRGRPPSLAGKSLTALCVNCQMQGSFFSAAPWARRSSGRDKHQVLSPDDFGGPFGFDWNLFILSISRKADLAPGKHCDPEN